METYGAPPFALTRHSSSFIRSVSITLSSIDASGFFHIEQARVAHVSKHASDDYDWALRAARILRDLLLALAQTDADFAIGFRQY